MALPTAAKTATYTAASTTEFAFTSTGAEVAGSALSWTTPIVVDSTTGVAISVFCTDSLVQAALVGPTGKAVPLESYRNEVTVPLGDDPSRRLNGTEWSFANPTPGTYHLTLSATKPETVLAARGVRAARRAQQVVRPAAETLDGFLIVWNESPDMLYAHVTNANLPVVGSMVGVVGKMVDNDASPMETFLGTARSPPASGMSVTSAVLEAVFPDGNTKTVPMQDDGLHNDGNPNDNEYGGLVMATEPGKYRFRATLQGTTSEGHAYERVFVQEMVVDVSTISLKSMAVATITNGNDRIRIRIPVKSNVPRAAETTFRPFFELWGKGAKGEDVPVAFSTNLAAVSRALWFQFLELEVDMRWITMANVTGPLTLKNIYVQNAESLATQTTAASLPVHFCGKEELEAASELPAASTAAGTKAFADAAAKHAKAFDGKVTWEMRNGVAPLRAKKAGAEPTLVLLHGFCADKNPFEVQAEDWTQAAFYSAAREGDALGRSNAQFANDVLAWVEKQGIDTFGLVGQSQGGMVSLHILNYFHTGLDSSVGERKLQSVATPFMGNTALTSLNGIIDIIGGVSGCSGPYDLTRSGAMEWNAGISTENADQTNYYYTEYSPGGIFGGGYCNSVMNLILNGKNDGVCENAYVSPDGRGNDQGLIAGWCHAEDMEWPPSFWDKERNAEMNKKGAR